MSRLTPEREALLRQAICHNEWGCYCDGACDITVELLSEIDALREENAKLNGQNIRLLEDHERCATLELENQLLRVENKK